MGTGRHTVVLVVGSATLHGGRFVPLIGNGRSWAGAAYLSVLVLFPMVTGLIRLQFQDYVVPGGERFDAAVQGVLLLTSLALWLLAPRGNQWPPTIRVFLVGFFVAWIFTVAVLTAHGDEIRREYIAVPIALILISAKPLSTSQLLLSLRLVLTGCAGLAVLSLPGIRRVSADYGHSFVTEALGVPGWQAFAPGVQGSWGMTAGFLGLLATMLTRRWSISVLTVAVITVLIAGQESAMVGFACGIGVLVLMHPQGARQRQGIIFLAAGAAFVAALVVLNPTGSGRTDEWGAWFAKTFEAPLFGIGATGIEAWHFWTHGHNLVLDAGVRVGLVGLALYLAVIALALRPAWQAAHFGAKGPLAAIISMLVAAMFNIEPYFNFWSIGSALLVLAVLLAGSIVADARTEGDHSAHTEAAARVPRSGHP